MMEETFPVLAVVLGYILLGAWVLSRKKEESLPENKGGFLKDLRLWAIFAILLQVFIYICLG